MRAIVVTETGGAEVLRPGESEAPKAGPGSLLVRIEAIGVNFIDVYHRTGLYKLPLPFTPGSEAAGLVEETGEGVTEFRRGDLVAWAMVPGAYAEYAVVPQAKAVNVPAGLDARLAAAALLQGLTAQYLVRSTYVVREGDTVLVHAAAGGVGGLLVQTAKLCGARVIGTVSSEAKAQIAREAGADHVIRYDEADFEAEVMKLTEGRGVNAVYDAVGRTTFDRSLQCVARRGVLALYGQASGPVPPVDPARLAPKSIFLTRPGLANYTATREELVERSAELFGWIESGRLRVRIDRELPLADAAEAHRLLEGRATTGKLLLVP